MEMSKEAIMVKKGIFILMVFGLIFMLGSKSEATEYTMKIKISNPTANTRSNYPVRVDIPAKTLIEAGRMNSDLRDIRFHDSSGADLPFWIKITEGMQREIKNLPVWVRLNTLSPVEVGNPEGDNFIYMTFDTARTKTDSPLPPSGTYCGDHYTSPFSADECGNNVFSLFSFDYRDSSSYTKSTCGIWGAGSWGSDWNRSGSPTNSWVSTKSFQNSFDLYYRYHLYIGHEWSVYVLTQDNADPTRLESRYAGYKVFVDYISSGGLYGNYKIKVYRKSSYNGTWYEADTWDSSYPSGGFTWKPYHNSIQDFNIKVISNKITVYINGNTIGDVSRSDSFSGGYVGFYSTDTTGGECDSFSTHTISPIWVIDDYIGKELKVEVLGHTDVMIKRIKPTADAGYIGQDIIEAMARQQILEDYVDGNTLEKYIYSAYPMASLESQVFKYSLKIQNRADIGSDTFNIALTPTGDMNNWHIAYDYGSGLVFDLPGTGGTPTTGSVTLGASDTQVIDVFVMPSSNALFEGAQGKLILDFEVNSDADSSFDHARFVANVIGKSGCYWKWKMPITVSYNDISGTGDLIDYQVLVTVTGVSELSEARPDGSDIVFTDSSGTKLSFWRKSFNQASGNASYWVKVAKVLSGSPGQSTIYMWWGNPNYASDRSSKEETFDLWEDWEGRTVDDVVGCPDNTPDCLNKPNDPDGWKNYPDPQDNFNWWTIQKDLDNQSVTASETGSNDYGPILSGGDVRWRNYELLYKHKKSGYGTNAYYDPILYSDPGNMWGIEYYSNKFIFRPSTNGTDWTWVYQTSESDFPVEGSYYTSKIRVFKNPSTGRQHLQILITDPNSNPADIDSDTGFHTLADFYPDLSLSLDSGAIGFGGWSGGMSFDNIRVRKYTEPEPACSAGSSLSTNFQPVASLSSPNLTPPFMNGRSVLLTATMTPWKWTGNLTAIFADCYINGDCQTGESQDHTGTISLWGQIDSDTPKGFGEQLKEAVAGDDNRSSIEDSNWKSNGRYIFTAYDSNADGQITCTSTEGGDCLGFEVSNSSSLQGPLGVSSQTEAENLIKFVRGRYVSGYARSDTRNECASGNADTCQWKLGDVVHSNPLVVGIPNMLYADPDYSTYQNDNNDRDLVAYFSSNDGIVHAVRLAYYDTTTKKYTKDTNATELWAFIPNDVLPVLQNTTDDYHEYTTDGLFRAIDIKSGDSYKTILLGGLRSGGQSLFAIDITDPHSPVLMWEINSQTNPTEFGNMGETWSAPALGRLCEVSSCDYDSSSNRWVAIIGSGFDPNDINNLSKNAYLTIINFETGSVIGQIKVSDKVGNITTNFAGLRDKNGFFQKIFFGDYYGALWKIDISDSTKVSTFLSKTQLSATTDMLFQPADYATSDINTSPPERPITAQPRIAFAGNDQFWIYVGTGVYNEYDSAYPYQRFYGFKDKDTGLPYTDSDLVDMTSTTASNSSKVSWYIELGHTDSKDVELTGTTNTACKTSCSNDGYSADYCNSVCKNVQASTKDRNERVLNSPEVYGGFIFFSTFTPENAPCGGGTARFYAVSYKTGAYKSGLMLFGNETEARSLAISSGAGVPSKPMIFVGKSGEGQIVAAGLVNVATGSLTKVMLNPNDFQGLLNILLWREIR